MDRFSERIFLNTTDSYQFSYNGRSIRSLPERRSIYIILDDASDIVTEVKKLQKIKVLIDAGCVMRDLRDIGDSGSILFATSNNSEDCSNGNTVITRDHIGYKHHLESSSFGFFVTKSVGDKCQLKFKSPVNLTQTIEGNMDTSKIEDEGQLEFISSVI